jgi:hypothetical protein
MNILYCACMGAMFKWYHTLGLRIFKLEQRMDYLEQHVVIDIDTLKN